MKWLERSRFREWSGLDLSQTGTRERLLCMYVYVSRVHLSLKDLPTWLTTNCQLLGNVVRKLSTWLEIIVAIKQGANGVKIVSIPNYKCVSPIYAVILSNSYRNRLAGYLDVRRQLLNQSINRFHIYPDNKAIGAHLSSTSETIPLWWNFQSKGSDSQTASNEFQIDCYESVIWSAFTSLR